MMHDGWSQGPGYHGNNEKSQGAQFSVLGRVFYCLRKTRQEKPRCFGSAFLTVFFLAKHVSLENRSEEKLRHRRPAFLTKLFGAREIAAESKHTTAPGALSPEKRYYQISHWMRTEIKAIVKWSLPVNVRRRSFSSALFSVSPRPQHSDGLRKAPLEKPAAVSRNCHFCPVRHFLRRE